MIRNIVFDMGNVLIRYNPMDYIAPLVEAPGDQQLLLRELFASLEWIQADRGAITDEDMIASVNRRLPAHLHDVCGRLVREWHSEIPSFPDMEALVAKLKAAGYGIYLLSNTSARFHDFKKNIPTLQYFDGLFISADHGVLKPDREIYRRFFDEFKLQAEECFFIDDNAMNIEAAAELGMRGYVFRGDVVALINALRDAGVTV